MTSGSSAFQRFFAGSRGGRMTKWKGRVASAAPYMLYATMSVAALSSSMAIADTIATPEMGPVNLIATEDHEITATGSVTLTSTSGPAVAIDGPYADSFTNNGVVAATTTGVSSALGVLLDGDLSAGGQLVNNGSITLSQAGTSSASSLGIVVGGATEGSLVNNGSIVIDNTAGLTPDEAAGLGLLTPFVDESGNITNTGNIDIALSANSDAIAYGIVSFAGVAGSINNSGAIGVELEAAGGRASGYGIYTGDVVATGSINNTGAVSVDASGDTQAEAYGIEVDGDSDGALMNSGTINAVASASSSAVASGVLVEDTVGGSLTNSGTIVAEANATSFAEAYGIAVEDVAAGGQLTNSGTVTVEVSTSSSASGFGVFVDDALSGSIINSGTIDIDNDAGFQVQLAGVVVGEVAVGGLISNDNTITVNVDGSSSAAGYGVQVRGGVAGTLQNTGTIAIDSDGSTSAMASGISAVSVGETGVINNTGTISLEVDASSEADGYGVRVTGLVDGTVANSGTISVDATSTGDEAIAAGLYADSVGETGAIRNTGTINLSGFGESSAYGYGVHVDGTVAGEVSNTGTIDIEMSAEDDYVYVHGIRIEDTLAATGTVSNSGDISATAIGSNGSTAHAWGIYLRHTAEGDIINTGTIDVLATGETSARAYGAGIETENQLSGTVENAGTIMVRVESGESSADALGIFVANPMLTGAEVINSGTIAAAAVTGTDEDADAYGVQIDGRMESGTSLVNAGRIEATAESTEANAAAYGILVDDTAEDGSVINNSGTVIVDAFSDSDATYGWGISIAGALDGSLFNSGAISVHTQSDLDDEAHAEGLSIASGVGGTLLNSGDITALVEGVTGATVYGVEIRGGGISGEVINSGNVTATAMAETDEAYAYGIEVRGNIDGVLRNSGTITARAEAQTSATVYGMEIRSQINGTLENSGTITAYGLDRTSSVEAYGIDIGNTVSGAIVNSGTISAMAENTADGDAGLYALGIGLPRLAADGTFENTGTINAAAINAGGATYVSAIGVFVGDIDGTFSNTGTISAVAQNDGDVTDSAVYGIYVANLNGEITDVGTISTTSDNPDADVYAIYARDGMGTISLDTDDTVTGLIGVSAHNVDLFAEEGSGSAVFAFEDRDVAAGTFTTGVANESLVWFVEDEGGENPVYATVDAADMLLFVASAGEAGSMLDGLSAGLPSGGGLEVTQNRVAFGDDATGGMRPFVSANLNSTSFEGVDGVNDVESISLDATFGYGGELASGLGLAIGGGVFTTSGTSGPNDFDSQGFFGGVTIGQDVGGFNLEGGVGLGLISTENSRGMAGGPAADASIDSMFTTVHAGFSRDFSLGSDLALTGFGNLRYTQLNVEGYEETGSMANAAVSDYAQNTSEFVLGVEAAYAVGDTGKLTGALTAVSRTMDGDDSIDVSVFGSTNSLATTASDFAGGGVEIGYEMAFGDSGNFDISLGQEFGDGASGPNVGAGISWSF